MSNATDETTMSTELREFRFSGRDGRRRVLGVLAVLPVVVPCAGFIVACFWGGSDVSGSSRFAARVTTILIPLVALVAGAEALILYFLWRRQKVLIADECLLHDNGKKKRAIPWHEIVEVRQLRRPNGRVRVLSIRTSTGAALDIHDYKDMEGIAALIAEKAPASAEVIVKGELLDWASAGTTAAMVLVGTAVLLMGLSALGRWTLDFWIVLCFLGGAIALLILRPMKRSNARLARFEVAFAFALIAWAVLWAVLAVHEYG